MLTALIIDDERDICFLLSNILRNNNVDVNYVNTLGDGKIYLQNHEPAVLFLDNHLPDGLGIEFINYVKEQHAATKIIIVTAHDTPEDRSRALKHGANLFISKPFTAAEILNALRQLNLETV